MLDIASINTAPDAAKLSLASPAKDTSLAASVGPTTTVTSDGPDLWHRLWGKDGFSFATLLDIVNPLQHIPVVSTVYQKLTGDIASPGAELVGGALFGGPVGLAVAAVDTAIKGETGNDIGGHVLALFDPGKTNDAPDGKAAVAQADDPPPATDRPSGAAVAETAAENATPKASDASAPAPSDKQQADAAKDNADSTSAPSPAAAPTQTADVAKAPSAEADKDAPKPAAKIPAADTETPKSAFVLAHSSPRTYSGKGAGSAYVPLETRSTILPAAYFAPPPAGAPEIAKSAKSSSQAFPDPKALAADPALLRQFQAGRAAGIAAAPGVTRGADAAAAAAADPNGFAALMARNLQHYMALQNKAAAPTVDKRF